MSTPNTDFWRKCTTCKKPIGFNQKYWICSVSTCNRVRTDLAFCDLRCFDAHIPVMNHRDAGAFERVAPKGPLPQPEATPPKPNRSSDPDEVLVVVSKVKTYIREVSGMNTADAVMRVLSQKVKKMADLGIDSAQRQGRKTVLERDI